jgi:putative glutathione S-transferase
MRELYQVPSVAATIKPRYYVMNYYSIAKLNPTGIIPKGPPVDLGRKIKRGLRHNQGG